MQKLNWKKRSEGQSKFNAFFMGTRKKFVKYSMTFFVVFFCSKLTLIELYTILFIYIKKLYQTVIMEGQLKEIYWIILNEIS